jgi:hypothetical protein
MSNYCKLDIIHKPWKYKDKNMGTMLKVHMLWSKVHASPSLDYELDGHTNIMHTGKMIPGGNGHCHRKSWIFDYGIWLKIALNI